MNGLGGKSTFFFFFFFFFLIFFFFFFFFFLDDVEFRLAFLPICCLFDETQSLQDEIYDRYA